MRNILVTVVFTLFCISVFSQSKIVIGMSIDEVNKIYPGMKLSTYQDSKTLERPENIYGLDDVWGYRFEGEKLNWIFFHKYLDALNETNFKKCLSATKSVIRDYSKIFGKPDTSFTGDTVFIDPYRKKHWGYNVMEARWKNYKGMKIKVAFTFLGGKGEYHFLVSINYFDQSYPYYD